MKINEYLSQQKDNILTTHTQSSETKKKIKQRNKISMHLDGKCNNLTNELNSTILDIRAAGSIE